MPNQRAMLTQELEQGGWPQRLKINMDEVYERILKGQHLVLEESAFDDPGPDYSRVLLGGEPIAEWPGY